MEEGVYTPDHQWGAKMQPQLQEVAHHSQEVYRNFEERHMGFVVVHRDFEEHRNSLEEDYREAQDHRDFVREAENHKVADWRVVCCRQNLDLHLETCSYSLLLNCYK